MAAKFVRIPFGARMKFPAVCPFTGQANPRGAVRISRSATQLVLPIPLIGLFSLGKSGRMSFPASALIAWGEKLLTLLTWLALIGGFAIFFVLGKRSQGKDVYDGRDIYSLIGGVLMFYVLKIVRWLWLSRVRIVRVGMTSLEIKFASEQYATELARLNGLHASGHRTKKRAAPVTVNAVH
jgi:hypothetical protein